MTSVSLAAVIGGAEISGVTRAAIALVLVVAALLKLVRPGEPCRVWSAWGSLEEPRAPLSQR